MGKGVEDRWIPTFIGIFSLLLKKKVCSFSQNYYDNKISKNEIFIYEQEEIYVLVPWALDQKRKMSYRILIQSRLQTVSTSEWSGGQNWFLVRPLDYLENTVIEPGSQPLILTSM